MSKFTKKCMAITSGCCPNTASAIACTRMAISIHSGLRFLNGSISVKTGPMNNKLGDFVNLGVLFLTMWIDSCSSHNLQTTYLVLFGLKSGNEQE